ncbi:MAG: helix-turn-helix transcriptional regulator [Deltaproteobacteria bacterium]|nr:helix-turn-helix transcriptional regulator [Deltaproteobacteria bacterium]
MSGPTKLRAWRVTQPSRLSMVDAAKAVRVTHASWHDWEKGKKKPDLSNALAIENLTDGAVRIEDWGYQAAAEAAGLVWARRHRNEAA